MTGQIEYLADHIDYLPTLGAWHFDQWGSGTPGASLSRWMIGIRAMAVRDRLPVIFIALDGNELLGSVSLFEHDLDARPDLTPWLADLYVKPARRRQGIGSALVRHAVSWSATRGFKRLYLFTHDSQKLYRSLGWRHLAEERHNSENVLVMTIQTSR